jgi:hypothetical protein
MKTEIVSEIGSVLVKMGWAMAVMMMVYCLSVGPAFRLHVNQMLPTGVLKIYRPITSIKSPVYRITFQYVLLWM